MLVLRLFLLISCFVFFAGCNGVKVVGNSIETHTKMQLVVNEKYDHATVVDCQSINIPGFCGQKSANFQAHSYVKQDNGSLQEWVVVTSVEITGSGELNFVTGEFFDLDGVRVCGNYLSFDIVDSDKEVILQAGLKSLKKNGISPKSEKFYLYNITRRIDLHNRVDWAYVLPESDVLLAMDEDERHQYLKERLLGAVHIQ